MDKKLKDVSKELHGELISVHMAGGILWGMYDDNNGCGTFILNDPHTGREIFNPCKNCFVVFYQDENENCPIILQSKL